MCIYIYIYINIYIYIFRLRATNYMMCPSVNGLDERFKLFLPPTSFDGSLDTKIT